MNRRQRRLLLRELFVEVARIRVSFLFASKYEYTVDLARQERTIVGR